MKNRNAPDPADPDAESDWIEALAVARPSPVEVTHRRQELAGRPKELQRLEQELALNALLDARPGAPRAASNFAAQVNERIAMEDRLGNLTRHRSARTGWALLFGGRAGWALAAATAVGLGVVWISLNRNHRAQMAASVATVALTASSPGLSADSLENYEIIRRLDAAAQPGDDALIAALAERIAP